MSSSSSIVPTLRIISTLLRANLTSTLSKPTILSTTTTSSLSSFWNKFFIPPFTSIPPQLRLGFELESLPSSQPSWLPKQQQHNNEQSHDNNENNEISTRSSKETLVDALTSGLWFAVPKRKKSYARKRQRQMSHVYASHNLSHLYPCPKCDHGYLKVRHHMCPCDQEKVGVNGIIKVTYGNNSVGLSNNTNNTQSTTPSTTPTDTGKSS